MTVINLEIDRLRYLDDLYQGRITTMASTQSNVERAVRGSRSRDRSGARPGARAPKVGLARSWWRRMKPGAVIVDVAVDQGGCFETTKPTTHSDPVYVVDGVLHYCVSEYAGIVPHTSTSP